MDPEIIFETIIIEWRGPAPFLFAPVPDEHVGAIRHAAMTESYGWGVVPVVATIGEQRICDLALPARRRISFAGQGRGAEIGARRPRRSDPCHNAGRPTRSALKRGLGGW
jgi:hypothetical protein